MGVMLHEGRMCFMKSFFPIRGQLLTYVIALAPREFSSVNLVEQCFQFRVRSFFFIQQNSYRNSGEVFRFLFLSTSKIALKNPL